MLAVRNLRKEFESVVAVDGVSLDVRRGELFGLLGPNGAGKTTTIRTVLNIIAPDAGMITFDGKPFSPETWNIVGYLPEERGLYRKSRVLNTIVYFASLKGMEQGAARREAYRWLQRFGLADRAYAKVQELSKGNQQKIQVISSLIHRPQLLILDEPFAGFDPVNQVLLKDILLEQRQRNVAIIFSTHQMEQVEKMCDDICLINKGKPVLSGSLRDVKNRYGRNTVRLEFEGDAAFLKSLPFVRRADVYQNYAEVEVADESSSRDLLKSLDDRLELRKFEVVEPSLNAIFLEVVGTGQPEPAEKPPVPRPQPARKATMDARSKRDLLSFILVSVVALVLIVANLTRENPDWLVPIIFLAAAGFSLYRFLTGRRKQPPVGGQKA